MIKERLRGLARIAAVLALGSAFGLESACSSGSIPIVPEKAPDRRRAETAPTYGNKNESIFGDSGLNIFGSEKKTPGDSGGGGLGVNSFLWRASLDTISFMPVASADPFGGVIITDWYFYNEAPDERFKLNVYILGRALRADGVRVAVFRQVQDGSAWKDAPMPDQIDAKIEDAILTRARQLRNQTVQQ